MASQRKSRNPEKQGSRPHLLQSVGSNTRSQKIRAAQLCEFTNGCFPCFVHFTVVIGKSFGAAGLKDVFTSRHL